MRSRVYSLTVCSFISAFLLFSAGTASALNGVWNGSENGFWTNSANWSASSYPSGVNETAFFTGSGNDQTNVDLTGFLYIRNIRFETPSVAAYTIGAGAANSQTLVLADSGEIVLASTANNSQAFNCGLQLGGDLSVQSYTFRNDNPAQTLTFADVFGCPIESGPAATAPLVKTLTVHGNGPVKFNSLRLGGALIYLNTYNSNTLTLAGSNTLTQINFYSASGNTLDIGDKELYLSNSGGNPLNCYQDTTINGSGSLKLSTLDTALNGGYNYSDLNVTFGHTLTVNANMTGLGGIEIWTSTGNYVFNGTNTFLGHIAFGTTSSLFVQRIGNRGSLTSNLGQGSNIYFNASGRLVYTGTGESSDRIIVINGGDPKIDQSGPRGKLTFTAPPTLLQSKTLTLQGSTAGVGEFSAPLANTGVNTLTLAKAGSGTWILSGTNSFTGSTTVNGGKLLVNSPGLLGAGSAVTVNNGTILGGTGKINGTVTVPAGGTLAPGDVNTVGTLSLNSSLTLTSATLLYDLTTPDGLSSATDKVSVASLVTVNGTNTITVSFPSGSAPAGSYTLMTFPYRAGTGAFVLSPAYPNVSLFTNATLVRLDVAPGGAGSLLWKGDTSANWDADPNWYTNGAALAFTPGDAVAFDDTAAQFTVASTELVAPSSVIFNNSLSNYTVTASITGTGAVYKLGSGEVTLTGNSFFSNTMTIASGLLRIGMGGVLGGGNFGTNIINNGELVYASSVAQTNSGIITGGGNVTVCGGSSLTLLGTNSFSGLTLVTNGTLRIGSVSALGSTSMGTIVAASGILELAAMPTGIVYAAEALELRGTLSCKNPGTNTYPAAISMYNNAVLDVGPGSALFVSIGTPNIGSNTVTKTGTGTLRFTGDPDHRSVFVVAEGTVELQHSGTTDAPFLISPGATLRQFNANDIGPYLVQADGTLDLLANGSIGGLSGAGLVTNSGASAITLTLGNSGLSGDFSGTIRNGAGAATVAISKTSTGIQTLSGANTYSGGTTLGGGVLNINSASALGTGTFTIGAYSFDNASPTNITLASNNAQAWNGDFTFIGGKSLNLGTGAAPMNGNRTVTILTNTLSVGGIVSGAYTLTKNGAGMLALSGVNTYSGATTINGGALLVNSPGSLATGSAVTVTPGAILGGSGTVNGTVTAATNSLLAPGGLNAVGTLTLANASATALTLNGATLLFDLSNDSGVVTNDQIALTGAGSKVVVSGVNRIALNLPTNGIPVGTYTLISSQAGIITNAGASFALLTTHPAASLTLSPTTSNLVLTITGDGIPGGAVWTGAATGIWDSEDQNWVTNGSVAATYPAGAAAIFDDTATAGRFSLSSSGSVSPATLLFNNSANDYSVAAQLDGTGPLTKQGSAAVTLLGMTTYNPGVIALNDGTLTFGGASQLNSGAYAGDIFNNGSLTFASSAAQTSSGMISGYGTLTKFGNGTLTLAGSNFYSGATIVNAGILKIQHAYGLGTILSGTTVNPGGTLELAGTINTLAEALSLYGTLSSQSGSNTFNGLVTMTAGSRIDVGTGSTIVLNNSGSSCIQANGPFVKTGGGRLVLMKDPNGNGLMTVREGIVDIAAGTMDANVVVNSGAFLSAVQDALNDNTTRVQVDAGGTYAVRGNDTIAGLAGAGLVTKDTSGSATLTIGNNSISEIFSGVITNGAGTLALVKNNTGVQILSGKNTYTGATTVQNSGALYIVSPGSLGNTLVTVNNTGTILGGNGSIQGAVTLAGYNILSPGVSNNVGTLTLGSTLAMTTSTLLCDIPAVPTDASDRVTVAGALTLTGSNVVSLSFSTGAAAAGDYTLMTFASKAGTGAFYLAGSYPNASLVPSNTNLILRVSGSGTSSLTWNGNASTSWDGTDANWLLGSAPATFTEGSAVAFNDAASSFNVTSLGDVTPSALVFNNAVNIYSVAANIKGTAPLNKFGLAATYLTGISSYNPSLIIIANGWVYLNQNAQLNNGVYSGNLVVNGGGLSYGSTPAQTLNGIISGSGGLIKTGSGTLTLMNTNTFQGTTTLNGGTLYAKAFSKVLGTGPLSLGGGTLELDHNAGLNFSNNTTVTASTTVKSGRLTYGSGVTNALGTLSIGAFTLTVQPGLNVNSGTPYGLMFSNTAISANAAFDVANNGAGIGTLTLGALSGNWNLTKAGAGLLYFGYPSLRAGGTNTLSAGTLKLGSATALGTNQVAVVLALNGGILDLATDVTATNYTTLVGGATTILSDKATPNSAGITHSLGNLTINNSLVVAAGANVQAGSPFGLTFGTNTLTGNASFDVASLGTLTLGVTSGNYGLTKAGPGTLVLANPNAYAGATTVTRGLLVVTGPNGSISNTSAITISGDGTLELRNSPATNWTDRVRNVAGITMAGGMLSFSHTGGATNYSESLGALSVTAGSNQLMTSQANVGYMSVVTLASIAHSGVSFINFVGAGLGESGQNRIFITGQPEGNLGPWATVNGTNFAYYSTTLGICSSTTTFDLAARGPGSVVPDNSNTVARISSIGVAGPITLDGALTNKIFAIRQNTGTNAVIATVNGATNKVLLTHGLFITDGQGSVTLGERLGEGFLAALSNSEGLLLDVDGTNGVLTLNAPIADVVGVTNVVKKYGSGKAILAVANTYAGATVVYEGTLVAQQANALGTTAGMTTVNTGAVLEVAGGITTAAEALTLMGTLSCQAGINTYAGVVTNQPGAVIDVGPSSLLILSAAPATAGAYGFTKTGSGTLRITGDPNQTGWYVVSAGTLELNYASGTQDVPITIDPGATLRELSANDLHDNLSLTNNGTFDLRTTDTIGMLVGSGLVTVGSGGSATLAIGNENKIATFSGVIENGSGTMNLNKSGAGTQILTGTNTYTGPTIVNERGGTLLVNAPGSLRATASVTVNSGATLGGNGTIMSPVTVAMGGCLLPADAGVIGAFTLGSALTLNSATLFYDLPATLAASDLINVSGVLTINGVNSIALAFPGGMATPGDYTLMNFAAKTGTGSFVLISQGNTPNATLELTASSLILHVDGGSSFGLTWNGNLSAVWDGGVPNWKSSGAAASYTDGAIVTFDDTALGNFTVYGVGSAINPAALYFNNSTNGYTVAAALAGTAPLVKSGWGTTYLTAPNNYNPSAITVNNGGALYIGNGNSAQLNNGTYDGPIFVNGGNFRYESSAPQTLNSLITGSGALYKYNAGVLTLTAANTYNGGTTHGAGQMNINNGGSGGTSSAIGRNRLYIGSGAIIDNTSGSDITLSTSNTQDWNGDFIYAGSGNSLNMGIGAVNLSGNRTITVRANTLTIGGVITQTASNYGLIKAGSGSLVLAGANAYANGTTLSGGTLYAQAKANVLGTGALTLNAAGTTLEYDNDTALTFNNAATVSASMTLKSGRLTSGPGVVHTLGTLSINASTLGVAPGTNALVHTPYGLTYGATTLTAGPAVFDVANNGSAPGTLTLGAVGGNYALIKKGGGVLKLASVNLLGGPITNNNGRILAVTGGACSNSSVTVQASDLADAAASLSVLYTAASTQWTCTNLVTGIASAPATSLPALEFSFAVLPSTTVAPFRVLNSVTFATNPVVNVYLGNLTVPANNYPLMIVGGIAPTNTIPPLNMVGGYTNSTLYWTNNTLTLKLVGSGVSLKWTPGVTSSGTWDINNSANLVWTNSVKKSYAYYQEPFGSGVSGDNVLFDDSMITGPSAVTLDGAPSPSSITMTNNLFAYTFTGSGNISGIGGLTKYGSNLLTLATANTYSGATTFASGRVNIPAGSGINVGNTANVGLLNVGTLASNTVLNITGGTVNATKNSAPALQVGTTSGAVGVINLSAGALYTGSELWLGAGGNGQNAFGALNVTGGSVTSASYLCVGRAPSVTGNNRGELLVSGGTITVNANNIEVGSYQNYSTNTSVATLTGGAMTLASGAGDLIVGNNQNGILNVSGSAVINVLNTGKALKVGGVSGVTGIANLNGGLVTVPAITQTAGAYGYLNFNGGTLKANRNNTAFMSGLTAARIYAGGATIDDGGYAITIAQPLLSPVTGNGVSLAGMTFSGKGFIAPPIVEVAGYGNGASAVATIDISGNIEAVTLTSPGANYHMGTPTLTFFGGGGTVTQTGSASTAPNTSGGLTKIGAGTLTLTGTNSFSGGTVVNNGRLVLVTGASCSNSAVTVQSIGTNAIFGVLYTGGDAQAAIAGLTAASGLSGGGAPDLEFAFSAVPSTTNAPLVVTGDATFNALPDVNVLLTGLTVPLGSYPLMKVGGSAPTATTPTLTVAGGYSGSTLSWVDNTLMLNLAGSSATIRWGAGPVGSGFWNVNDSTNLVWRDGSSAPTYYQEMPGTVGDQVVFDDAFITFNNVVTLNTTVTPASITANNSTFAYTLSGSWSIAGTNALVKSGAGNFKLSQSTPNTYSGGTLINVGGVLEVSHSGGLGTGGVTNNGTLNLNAGAGGGTDMNYTGLNNSLSGLGTNNVWLGTGAQRMQLLGNYSGFVGVWNIGIGAFAGGASRAEMTGLDNPAATINVLTNATVYVSAAGTHNATAYLFGGDTGEFYGQLRIDSGRWAGPVVLAGPITGVGDGYFGSASANSEIAGAISEVNGPYVVSKVGVFTNTFSGANTYVGPTAVMAGGLRVAALGNVGSGPGPLGAPTTPAQGTVKLGYATTAGTLVYAGMGETSDRIIDLAGTTGGGTIDHSGTNQLTLTGGLTCSGLGFKMLTLQGSTVGTGEFAGMITDSLTLASSNGVVKAGTGTWTLSNANTYSGGTQIRGGGTLVAAHPRALGTGSVLFPNEVGGLDLAHDGVGETPYEIFMQSGAVGTIKSNRSTPGEGLNHNFGVWHLSGVTAYVTNGANVVSGTPSITVAYLDLYAGSAQTTIVAPTTADLVITGGVSILQSAFDKTLQLDGTSQGSAILGPITNGLGKIVTLAKANTSTWTLYGSNTFSGTTTISKGSLVLSGTNGAFAGTSAITLSGNAILELRNSELTNATDRLRDAAGITLSGGTLSFAHTGGLADYSERIGALTVNVGTNTILTSQADNGKTSVVTFASMTRSTGAAVNFAGPGLGESDCNRIYITNQAAGPLGAWATVNGTNLAAYSAALGVHAAGSGDTNYFELAAHGPDSVISNSATAFARITAPGDYGPITLAGAWTNSILSVQQSQTVDAEITTISFTTNKTLLTSGLTIAAGQGAMKLGLNPGDGYLAALTSGGSVLLENDNTEALLTVNAAVVNNSTASTVDKYGSGTVVLAGSNTFSGAATINEGTLEFSGPFGQRLSNVIGGAGALAKSGTNVLHIWGANTYTGPTYIKQGTIRVDKDTTFGPTTSTNTPVTITDGGTLNIGCTPDVGGTRIQNALNFGNKQFVISGAGYLGQGAIINISTTSQYSAFGRIALADDATIGGPQRIDMSSVATAPALDLNDHTLTKTGACEFAIHGVQINPGAGKVVINQGLLRFETGSWVNGTTNNTVTVNSGGRLELYQLVNASPSLWSVILNDGAFFQGGGTLNVTNQNIWNGPIALNGNTFFNAGSTPTHWTVNGEISGTGKLVKMGGSATVTATLWLYGTNNTYSGGTLISNGVLFARYPGSLPGYNEGKVAVWGGATLAIPSGDGVTGWNAQQIQELHDTSTFTNNTAVLSIDTGLADVDYLGNLTKTLALSKKGMNTLTLNGTNTFTGAVAVNGGTLVLPSTSTNVTGAITVSGGSTNTSLVIDGVTTFISLNITNALTVAAVSGDRSTVTLSTNATFGKLLLGNASGASGAFIQKNGILAVGPAIGSTDVLSMGNGGYGYYRMDAGSLATGQFGLPGGGGGSGVFDLYNGTVNVQGPGGWLIWGWSTSASSIGVLNMFGGSLTSPAANDTTMAYGTYAGTIGIINMVGPSAFLDTTINSHFINMARNSGGYLSAINLNSGTLRANKVFAGVTGTPTVFGFNGGTLLAGTNSTTFMQGLTAALVYPGGGVIDSTNMVITIAQPLLAPVGCGVTSIPVLTGGSNYIGAPAVKITGGGGFGATAIATVDLADGSPTKGQVTGITVTSSGTGYQWYDAPVVTLVGGGFTAAATVGPAYVSPNASSGGLTKLGSGMLTLAGTNTFTGTTTISAGTLKLGIAGALMPSSPIVLAGGTLDLNGFTVSNLISGVGSVTNGTLYTVISPAGAGAVGTNTLSTTTATVKGTYIADLNSDGSSDRLNIQGNIDLSNLELQIVDKNALNRDRAYTILSCTGGTRTGKFIFDNSGMDSHWRLLYRTDGSVQLLFVDGTLIKVR